MDQVGKAFETLFMQTILKSMRDAQIEGGLLDSEHSKPFQSMLDGAYSELSVKTTKLGLAEAINRQFSPKTGSKATGLMPLNPLKINSVQADSLVNGLSNSMLAGQGLGARSVTANALPIGFPAPKMAPKFLSGD